MLIVKNAWLFKVVVICGTMKGGGALVCIEVDQLSSQLHRRTLVQIKMCT